MLTHQPCQSPMSLAINVTPEGYFLHHVDPDLLNCLLKRTDRSRKWSTWEAYYSFRWNKNYGKIFGGWFDTIWTCVCIYSKTTYFYIVIHFQIHVFSEKSVCFCDFQHMISRCHNRCIGTSLRHGTRAHWLITRLRFQWHGGVTRTLQKNKMSATDWLSIVYVESICRKMITLYIRCKMQPLKNNILFFLYFT